MYYHGRGRVTAPVVSPPPLSVSDGDDDDPMTDSSESVTSSGSSGGGSAGSGILVVSEAAPPPVTSSICLVTVRADEDVITPIVMRPPVARGAAGRRYSTGELAPAPPPPPFIRPLPSSSLPALNQLRYPRTPHQRVYPVSLAWSAASQAIAPWGNWRRRGDKHVSTVYVSPDGATTYDSPYATPLLEYFGPIHYNFEEQW